MDNLKPATWKKSHPPGSLLHDELCLNVARSYLQHKLILNQQTTEESSKLCSAVAAGDAAHLYHVNMYLQKGAGGGG